MTNVTKAEEHYKSGNEYSKKGDYKSAIAEFDKAIRQDPKYWEAYQCRASAYYNSQDDDSAIKDVTKAIELQPNAFVSYWIRGCSYGAKGNLNQAITDLEESLRICPGFPLAVQKLQEARQLRGY